MIAPANLRQAGNESAVSDGELVADTGRLQVDATKARIVFASAPRNVGMGLVGLTVVFLGTSIQAEDWVMQPAPAALAWCAVTVAALLGAMATATWFNSAQRSDQLAARVVRIYIWQILFVGAAWGASAFVLLPAQTLQQEGVLLVTTALGLTTGLAATIVVRSVSTAFCASLALVFAAGLARIGDPAHILIAIGFIAALITLIASARSQELTVTTAIELSFRNEQLLAERTQQEREARQAQADAELARERAETADRAKTVFIAAASHDLRQPMHAMVHYVEHLRRIVHDVAAQTSIAKIEESVFAMEDLLNAVLDFSKISMGSVKPREESVDVGRLLQSVDTQIRPLAEAKGLAFHVESRGGFVLSDEVLLERIIRNIAQNAVRYTESGTVAVRAVPRGRTVRILVSDSGIGIAPAEKTRIFGEYYQIDNRARDRRKGLGLGLAIVRDLAHLLGVRIRVKSIEGRGSTFALEVPRSERRPIAQSAQVAAAGADYVRGALVVLIDDDPLARDGVATTLQDFGCRVLAAASAEEAIEQLAQSEFPPQLIVSDYRLEGGRTGLEAIARVTASQAALYGESFTLPALLISGDTSPVELRRVAEAGYPMLHKPVKVELLCSTMNEVLEQSAKPAAHPTGH